MAFLIASDRPLVLPFADPGVDWLSDGGRAGEDPLSLPLLITEEAGRFVTGVAGLEKYDEISLDAILRVLRNMQFRI